MKIAEESPPPGAVPPLVPPWMAVFAGILPIKLTTISVHLALDDARQRLITTATAPTAQWNSDETPTLFSGQRRYAVDIHGDTMVIEGPLGYQETPLHTVARLSAMPQGTILQVASQLKGSYLVLLALGALVVLILACSTATSFVAIIIPLLAPYGLLVYGVKYEAGIITDQCVRALKHG